MSQHPNRLTDPLLGKMWKTKSARFNAHARLKAKHWLSTTATSILSFYLVVASLIPLVYETSLPSGGSKFLSVISLVISVFLIIITLLESAKNYHGEADRMHKCALEISELYNRFQAKSLQDADASRVELNDNYSRVLKAYEINHKDIDFLRFQIFFSRDLGIRGGRFAVAVVRYVLLWLVEYGLYIAMILAPPIAAFIYRSTLGF